MNYKIKACKEALERIEFYREHKEDNVFDVFYRSHLDIMKESLEEKLVRLEKEESDLEILRELVKVSYKGMGLGELIESEVEDFIKNLPNPALNIGELHGFDSKEMREVIILRIRFLEKKKEEELFTKSTIRSIKCSDILDCFNEKESNG